MNKQSVSKLGLFIRGVDARFHKNKDIFIQVSGTCVSGQKSYPFSIVFNGVYTLSFQNKTICGDFASLTDEILKNANLFDSILLKYADRAGTLILTADNRNVSVKTENEVQAFDNKEEKKYFISPLKAKKLLSILDFVTADGKIKNSHARKYAQAEHFIELLIPYIEKLPKEKEINIYDFACGKSYLSFFVNYYVTEVMKRRCRIIGLDINETVISASNKTKEQLQYYNMEFYCTDILAYEPKTEVDIAISLHACDVATDYAIAAAVNGGAKIVAIAPCCHKEFHADIQNEHLHAIFKYGIMKKRFSDLLTDVYRAEVLTENGYDVTMLEFVSPIETPKNLLILGYKSKELKPSDSRRIEKEFHVDPLLRKLVF